MRSAPPASTGTWGIGEWGLLSKRLREHGASENEVCSWSTYRPENEVCSSSVYRNMRHRRMRSALQAPAGTRGIREWGLLLKHLQTREWGLLLQRLQEHEASENEVCSRSACGNTGHQRMRSALEAPTDQRMRSAPPASTGTWGIGEWGLLSKRLRKHGASENEVCSWSTYRPENEVCSSSVYRNMRHRRMRSALQAPAGTRGIREWGLLLKHLQTREWGLLLQRLQEHEASENEVCSPSACGNTGHQRMRSALEAPTDQRMRSAPPASTGTWGIGEWGLLSKRLWEHGASENEVCSWSTYRPENEVCSSSVYRNMRHRRMRSALQAPAETRGIREWGLLLKHLQTREWGLLLQRLQEHEASENEVCSPSACGNTGHQRMRSALEAPTDQRMRSAPPASTGTWGIGEWGLLSKRLREHGASENEVCSWSTYRPENEVCSSSVYRNIRHRRMSSALQAPAGTRGIREWGLLLKHLQTREWGLLL